MYKFKKMALLACVALSIGCGNADKTSKTEGNATASNGDGTDHCAALVKKGEEVCNREETAKYGEKTVAKCLQQYKDAAKNGDQAKCKAMTPR